MAESSYTSTINEEPFDGRISRLTRIEGSGKDAFLDYLSQTIFTWIIRLWSKLYSQSFRQGLSIQTERGKRSLKGTEKAFVA